MSCDAGEETCGNLTPNTICDFLGYGWSKHGKFEMTFNSKSIGNHTCIFHVLFCMHNSKFSQSTKLGFVCSDYAWPTCLLADIGLPQNCNKGRPFIRKKLLGEQWQRNLFRFPSNLHPFSFFFRMIFKTQNSICFQRKVRKNCNPRNVVERFVGLAQQWTASG